METTLLEAKSVPQADALKRFYSPNNADRGGLDPASYRNYVAGVYAGAVEAQYREFRENLSREMKGASFGSTTTILLLNGAAIVSGLDGARALATASAITSGTYSALSKEVFYDKTLQALLAAMDARRTTAKIRLRTGLQQPADRYGLREAFDDIADLERQASLDVAVEGLTTLAATDAAAKQAILTSLYQAPILNEVTEERLASILAYVDALAASGTQADLDTLNAIAGIAGVSIGKAAATRNNIVVWMNNPAQTADIDALIAKLKPATKKDSY